MRCAWASPATRPPDLDWRMLTGGGLLVGIGLTMAMFIANLAFRESELASASWDIPGIGMCRTRGVGGAVGPKNHQQGPTGCAKGPWR